jgi:hypothetical protein
LAIKRDTFDCEDVGRESSMDMLSTLLALRR